MRNHHIEIAATLDPHHNFLARDGKTFCNVYTCAFFGLRGLVLPLTFNANELYEWLDDTGGRAAGWERASKSEALAAANGGGDVIAAVKGNPHGHIAPCVESLIGTPGRICVSAAGKDNFVRAPIERSFGNLSPAFFVHSRKE
jgi:hypothetical protein